MRLSFLRVSLICLLLSAALSCKKDGITEPPCDQIILIDESFEKDGRGSLAGWVPDDTTSHIKFSLDVPPGGGDWSLTIETGWFQIFYVSKKVPLFRGKNRYRLSFWAKAKYVQGFAYLNLNQGDSSGIRRLISVTDTAWSMYSVIDTISADTGDSILVGLTGGIGQLLIGPTWYDLVKLEKLD